jgi:hypothetical protein
MDLKKTVGRIVKNELIGGATNKILPMEGDKPKLSGKAKLAGILAAIAAIAGALSQYLSG